MKKRALLVIPGSIITLILFGILFIFLSKKNSKDCDQLVIDTYELASRINIPKQTHSQCYYNESKQLRVGIYSITNIDDFISTNGLEIIEDKENNILWSTDFLLKNSAIIPDTANYLYRAAGINKRNIWQCILERNTGKIWFEIRWD